MLHILWFLFILVSVLNVYKTEFTGTFVEPSHSTSVQVNRYMTATSKLEIIASYLSAVEEIDQENLDKSRQMNSKYNALKMNFFSETSVYRTPERMIKALDSFLRGNEVPAYLSEMAVKKLQELAVGDHTTDLDVKLGVQFTFCTPPSGNIEDDRIFGFFRFRISERNYYELKIEVMKGPVENMPDKYHEMICMISDSQKEMLTESSVHP